MALALILLSTHAVAFWLGVVLNERLSRQKPAPLFRTDHVPIFQQQEPIRRKFEDDTNPPGSL